ncbi:MAG: VWA domain-containing protein, partial [Chloroflexota bacterium]
SDYTGGDDFSLYYGIDAETISVNLLSFRESAAEDGFFMLLVQPPLTVPEDEVIPKDVIVVLDQSGSMSGDKWAQAQAATTYVLANLKSNDRFNVVAFSTGVRTYSLNMEPIAQVGDAVKWIEGLFPEGSTDINAALLTALEQTDPERETAVLFLTDGLATEGVIETADILDNLAEANRPNARIFTFGVGDDVDTFLLDQIVEDFNGTGSYVRPTERIDEEVASLYNKISAPVLTDVTLDFAGARVELLYPETINDLFAGEQITLVGRYRDGSDNLTLTLSGMVNREELVYIYNGLTLRSRAGGESFIPRLWATRRIGDLLNTIRLRGENQEVIDSIISLSVRYGIITPYTSFLIEEDDILSQQGRERAAQGFAEDAEALSEAFTGTGAVTAADEIGGLRDAAAPQAAPMPTGTAPGGTGGSTDDTDGMMPAGNAITTVNDKIFVVQDGAWIDTAFEPDTMSTEKVAFLSDAYFDLLTQYPALGDYFALGEWVIVVYEGVAYEVVPEA